MNKKVLFKSLVFLLGQFTLGTTVAAGVNPHKCPPEVIAAANIRLTDEYPHFLINWNTSAAGDEFYERCKDNQFTQCITETEFTPRDGKSLIIIGTPGVNIIRSSEYDDVVCGLGGNDIIAGGLGDDILYGNKGNDYIEGRQGNDTIYGGRGKDTLLGFDKQHVNLDYISLDAPTFGQTIPGTDNDILYGGRGWDLLYGGPHRDVMLGENGKDAFNGGKGVDAINGGIGIDSCVDVDGDSTDDCANSN